MLTIIGLLLLAAFVLLVIDFAVPRRGLLHAVCGCMLVAVALMAFGDRIVR